MVIGFIAGDLAIVVNAVTEGPGGAAEGWQVGHVGVAPQEPVELLLMRRCEVAAGAAAISTARRLFMVVALSRCTAGVRQRS